jgi:cyclopropane fatty-acyl-phospholipid synthase-like methyltransferase
LDIGCGYGRLTIPLAKKGYTVVGVDINQRYVEEAKKRSEGLDVTIHCRNIFQFNPQQKFENVLSMWNTLMHFDQNQLASLFSKVRSWMRDDGILLAELLYITKQDKQFLETRNDGSAFVFEVGENSIPMHIHPPETIRSLLKAANFSGYDVSIHKPYRGEHLQRIIVKGKK